MPQKDALVDLKKSGLTERDWKLLKIKYLTTAATNKFMESKKENTSVDSYEIPYFGMDNKPLHFSRIKLMGNMDQVKQMAVKFGIDPDTVKSSKGTMKYFQKSGTGVHLYLPPYINWLEVAEDPSITIYITEGEKKAAKSCKDSFPTTGLGGVDSFRDATGHSLFSDFNMFGRKVVICYDSDALTNKNIQKAESRLCQMLIDSGAVPYVKRIPIDSKKPDDKMGIDDYLVKFDKKKFEEIPETPMPLTKTLLKLNEHFATEIEHNTTLDKRTGMLHLAFASVATGLMSLTIGRDNVDDKGKKLNVPSIWNEWPAKSAYNAIVYEPGQPQEIDAPEKSKYQNFNIWRPGPESIKGDIKPFLAFLDFLVGEHLDKEQQEWLLNWIGYPLKYPGTKLATTVAIFSPAQGNGKTFLGDTIGKMYGASNYGKITQEAIESQFNSSQAHRQFIMGDEVSGNDARKYNDKLKIMITRDTIEVNKKYSPEVTMRDCANYYFTANHSDAFYVEPNDRRFFIIEGTSRSLASKEGAPILKCFKQWLAKEGVNHLKYYFESVRKYGSFEPTAPALATSTKDNMVVAGSSESDRWATELAENGEHYLSKLDPSGKRSWFTLKELLAQYDMTQRKTRSEVTARSLASALRRKPQFKAPKKVHTHSSGTVDLWLMRNQTAAKWKNYNDLKPAVIRRDYDIKENYPTQLKSVK